MSSCNKGGNSIGNCCDEMSKALKICLGPRGQLALIISPTGNATMTSSGKFILESIAGPNNCYITKAILKSVLNYHSRVGDGSKHFILIFHCFWKEICDNLRENNVELSRQINYFATRTLPDIFTLIRTSQVCLKGTTTTGYLKLIEGVIKMFFNGKFEPVSAGILRVKLYEFVSKSLNFDANFNSEIRFLIRNFNILKSTVKSCSENCRIFEGLLVNRPFLVCPEQLLNLRFIFVDSLVDNSEHIIHDTSNFLYPSNLISRIEYFLHLKIGLIFISSTTPAYLVNICKHLKMGLMCYGASALEKELMSSLIQPIENINCDSNPITERNIGTFDFAAKMCIGQTLFVHFGGFKNDIGGLKNDRGSLKNTLCRLTKDCGGLKMDLNGFKNNRVNIHHLLLCGATDTLVEKYAEECLNCLKLLSYLTNSEEGNDLLACCSGASWEIQLANRLNGLQHANFVTQALSKALMCIPRTLHQLSNSQKRFIEIEMQLSKPVGINPVTGEVVNELSFYIAEPVIAKEVLICDILSLVVRLLKMDFNMVLPMNKK